MSGANLNQDTWTYGAEHEWADWHTTDPARPLPPGYGRDRKDITIVNSTGVANDPKDKLHDRGGEINTPPTSSPWGQIGCMQELRALYPEATVNYRSNLHLHIRVPGLRDDLDALKRVQARIHEWMPRALPVIEPLEMGFIGKYSGLYPLSEIEKGWKRRLRRMRVSHQTLLPASRVAAQLAATTVEEFHAREVPVDRHGRVMWHAQPRVCVNLRQLRETDTVEFRHWPGTMRETELEAALLWCQGFMVAALEGDDPAFEALLSWAQRQVFPRFQPYDHWLEERYRRTVHDGTIPRDQLPINIANVLKETRP